MRVLLRKSSDARVIIPCPEIIRPALYVEIFSAIAERVGIGADTVFLVAEGVVVVGFCLCSGGAAGSPRAAKPPGNWIIVISRFDLFE